MAKDEDRATLDRLREPDEATLATAEKALRSTWNKPARERVLAVSRALAAAFEGGADGNKA